MQRAQKCSQWEANRTMQLKREQPKHIHNHLQGNDLERQQIFINIEANHRLQKEPLTNDHGNYTVTSALPPAWSVALTKHLCLSVMLLIHQTSNPYTFCNTPSELQIRTPVQKQHSQRCLQTRASFSLLSQSSCAFISE